MPAPFDMEITRVRVAKDVSIPAANWTGPEKTAFDARLVGVENRGFVGLPDVDPDGLEIGDVFIWDGSKLVRTPLPGSAVWGSITGTLGAQADLATALNGKATSSHNHTLPAVTRYGFGSDGSTPYLSSGSVTKISQSIGPFEVGVATLVTVEAHINAQGIDDPSNNHITVTIDGNTSSSNELDGVTPYRWEWGVDGEKTWHHSRIITRATSGQPANRTISVGLTRVSGGPLQITSGYAVVTIFKPR